MTQLPTGLRRALYLRDDDYRLSFLQGNFVTLTNLSDADVDRIVEQRLSPLYVSLHAVEPEVRAKLVCAREDRALERFDELLDGGIELHVQIVLVPGVNDGDELEGTLAWLAEREGVASVGVVPLGYTAHQERFAQFVRPTGGRRAVIDQVEPWHDAMRERDGAGWVYLADEFYLAAGRPSPARGGLRRLPAVRERHRARPRVRRRAWRTVQHTRRGGGGGSPRGGRRWSWSRASCSRPCSTQCSRRGALEGAHE